MTKLDRIECNPKVCNEKPLIKGTRIPISVILDQIAQGESWDDLLKKDILNWKNMISISHLLRASLCELRPEKSFGAAENAERRKFELCCVLQ